MIRINLDDLTQEHVDRCARTLGRCSYAAPCIIGTLTGDLGDANWTRVAGLLDQGIISLPAEQRDEAVELQAAFDSSNLPALADLLAKRGLEWPVQ